MKLKQYLNESKEGNVLKKLNQWKKDLRRMTKLYKSIDTSETPKATKQFNNARKAFGIFRTNWEHWYEQEIMIDKKDRISIDISQEEKDMVQDIKVKAWQATMATNSLFPEAYDYKVGKHVSAPWELDNPNLGIGGKGSTRKNLVLVYQKKFKLAFDAIEKLVKYDSERVNTLKDTEKQNVRGINVLISGMKEKEDPNSPNMKRTKKFINNDLPKALDLIKKEGIKQVLKGCTMELTLTGSKSVGVQSGAGGSYERTKDWLRMYPMGMGSDSIPTIVHELGHRYYFRILSDNAQKAWDKFFLKSSIKIQSFHIEEFWKKYVKLDFDGWRLYDKDPIIKAVRKQESNATLKAVFLHLANNLWGTSGDHEDLTHDEIETKEKEKFKKNNVGEFIPFEFITDYGRTNAHEAFAETFKLWVTGKKGRLGEWTREFFKEVVRSGGSNIKEDVDIIEKYIK